MRPFKVKCKKTNIKYVVFDSDNGCYLLGEDVGNNMKVITMAILAVGYIHEGFL